MSSLPIPGPSDAAGLTRGDRYSPADGLGSNPSDHLPLINSRFTSAPFSSPPFSGVPFGDDVFTDLPVSLERRLQQRPAPRPSVDARQRRTRWFLLLLGDLISLTVALVGGQLLERALVGRGSILDALLSAMYVPVFVVILHWYGLYELRHRRLVASSVPDTLGRLSHGILAAGLVLLFAAGGFHRWVGAPPVDRVGSTFICAVALVGVPLGRRLTRRAFSRPRGAKSKVIIVGSGLVAASLQTRLAQVDDLEVVGCVDDNDMNRVGPWADIDLLGGLDDLPALVAEHGAEHIVVAFSPQPGAKLVGILRSFAGNVQISVVPRLFDLLTVRSRVEDLAGLTVVDVASPSLGLADRFIKRTLDIVGATIALTLLSPLLLAIALIIKLTSPGPAVFKQSRSGRAGRPFMIYKFRTMRVGAEAEKEDLAAANEVDGPLFKMRRDPRITSIGHRLRQTSLDELPQFINVLKGEMSLVGPRPFVTSESEEIAGWAARRFDVRPGMTGLWQTSGRNDLPFDELCRLDHAYVASWSVGWDLRILWHTPAAVFCRRRGAY